MRTNAVIRSDFFSGSGVGHLKRSSVLARALEQRGIRVTMILDTQPLSFNWVKDLNIEIFNSTSFSESEDATKIILYSKANDINLVIVDSYRITVDWIEKVRLAGLRVLAIDDLNTLDNANLRVNYSPLAQSLPNCSQELLGPSYFLTDTKRIDKRSTLKPESVIFHAGGNGDFSSNEHTIQCLLSEARESQLSVTWLIANYKSKIWLENKKLIDDLDTLLEWNFNEPIRWGDYDIVVGPASTSLYEAIMQGSLPISFTLSPSQNDDRLCWLSLGHALHITNRESQDAACVKGTFINAIKHYCILMKWLRIYSHELDGLGVHRIVDILLQKPLTSSTPSSSMPDSQTTSVLKCSFTDAAEFLHARNAEFVRSMSTSNREITWSEHVNWWLTGNVERFTILKDSKKRAFFWHKSKVLDVKKFLIGGWFPVYNQLNFDIAIRLLEWQLDYCSTKYDDHLWVATINPLNKAVIVLNKRFGFKEASANTRTYLNDLFPGTPDDFVALERPAILCTNTYE